MSEAPWIHRLNSALAKLQNVSGQELMPPFPWEKAAENLKEALHLKSLQITAATRRLLPTEELLKGMGQDPLLLTLSLIPFTGDAFWVMPKAEVEKLSGLLLTTEAAAKGFAGEDFNEGFARFLLLAALRNLNEINAFNDFTAQIAPPAEMPKEGAHCQDISIEIGHHKVWARLIYSEALLKEIQTHFSTAEPSFHFPPDLPVSLSVEIGSTALSADQWGNIKNGDLLLLDRCSFDLLHKKGSAILSVSTTPLFEVRLKEGEIKILDHAFFEEHPSEETSDELAITVEAARLTMPLDQVAQLKPDQVLELTLSPELTVSLTMGGERIAKGELVKIGESSGVKILATYD